MLHEDVLSLSALPNCNMSSITSWENLKRVREQSIHALFIHCIAVLNGKIDFCYVKNYQFINQHHIISNKC